jgi:hypothetical protein
LGNPFLTEHQKVFDETDSFSLSGDAYGGFSGETPEIGVVAWF